MGKRNTKEIMGAYQRYDNSEVVQDTNASIHNNQSRSDMSFDGTHNNSRSNLSALGRDSNEQG